MDKNTKNRTLSFAIETYGCQMNKYDSEIVAGILVAEGYKNCHDLTVADILLINTCSVRDHAEKRALGRIHSLIHWKEEVPHRKLGIIGCMAQRMGETLLQRNPFLDFVVGPDDYRRLPEILTDGQCGTRIQTRLCSEEVYNSVVPHRKLGVTGWVAIMRGCNNFCSYCIVPYIRGQERSRRADEILREIERMAEQGFVEIVLLGQNVNSYNDGQYRFSDLLKSVGCVPKIQRIRFMTSHPKDLSEDLLEVMADNKKVCHHIHLPAQSGSNQILSKMNRGYTREKYLELVQRARTYVPDVAITTDILVGFPGETESDFLDTYTLIQKVRFDDAFMYRYSPREGTKAAQLKNELPEEEKLNRLRRIIKLQREISLQKKQDMIGRRFEVLAEGASKQSSEEWMGKTSTNHVVIFPKNNLPLGQPTEVLIKELRGSTLWGTPQNTENFTGQLKSRSKPCGS